MIPIRLLPTVLLALCVGLVASCGDPVSESSVNDEERATKPTESSSSTELDALEQSIDTDGSTEGEDGALLRTTISEDELDLLTGGGLLEGAAGPVPEADTHFPVEGPRGGALFSLGVDRGFYEYSHNEHWGTSALYLYDAAMKRREWDVPPVLSVWVEEASLALTPQRENFDEVEDGGWHFEDDHLLGYPEAGRFRLIVDGRVYSPAFEHIHVGHGQGHAHAAEHATGPHLHGLGPHRGHVLTLGAHLAHLEVAHKPHWGILGVYLYDAAMEPRELDAPPILNIVSDGEPLQLTAGRENWDGEDDGGWHFEDDALLGATGSARFRVVVDGKTYVPPFTYYTHGEEPGHSHDSGGAGADGH